ncbi:hypothetical protein B0T25DRAFT_592068 [Lasiosphaeria hispida]|uniref:Uncharacterized protein n=1 Tax=Lasiosphaeria hispida TaxID=260671 RepID=A0AAJ0HFT7_9PEZI|nr:hypothetical protein B0T25DRAFT_592068 [Lasiosphaeria hispida]
MIAFQNRDRLGINYEQLDRLPFWAPLFGYTTETWFKSGIASDVMAYSEVVARALSPTEAQGIAESGAKARTLVAWTPPLTAALAFFFTWRGRGRFRFPFKTPGPTFDPTIFRVLAWLDTSPVIYGPHAIRAWHSLRFASYSALSYFAIKTVIGPFALAGHSVRLMQDPRTKDLFKEIQARAKHARQTGIDPRGSASPSGGQFPKQSEQQTWQLPPPQSEQRSWQDDEPSSLGDEHVQPAAPASSSSWDRLRRDGAVSARAASRRSQDGNEAQRSDSYVYSQSDEDSQSAKEQAQREFDAMLERERQSENSDSQDPF